MHQKAQYDNKGNLLFFVIDGNIYNKDGYEIADAQFVYTDGIPSVNECDICIPTNQPDVSVIPVPGSCTLYYIVFSFLEEDDSQTAIFNEDGVHLFYTIIDISAINDNFNDPEILGDLIAEGQVSDYPQLNQERLNGWLAEMIAFDYNDALLSQKPFIFQGTLDYEDNPFKRFYASYGGHVKSYSVTSSEISIDPTNVIFGSCGSSGFNGDDSESNNSIQNGMRGGELEISYCNDLQSYVLSTSDASGDPSFTTVHAILLNDDGTFTEDVPGLFCLDGYIEAIIAGHEFSPSGNYLYINIGNQNASSPVTSAEIRCIEVSTDQFAPLPNLDSFLPELLSDRYYLSRIESGYFEGEPVLYLQGDNGQLAIIRNPDEPQNATIEEITTSTSVLNCDYTAGLEFAAIDGIDEEMAFRFFTEQNYNGTQIQDYMASAACCLELSPIVNEPYTYFNGTEDWEGTDNPFDSEVVCFDGNLVFGPDANYDIFDMRFEFGPDAEMIVEPGAYVRMSNCVLTSLSCNKAMWPGVTIEGTANITQGTGAGITQGKFVLRANSLLENATFGVWVDGGAIFKGFNSRFEDNWVGIYMKPHLFENEANKTRIDNCTFDWTGIFNDPSLEPQFHVYMSKVQGVYLKESSFLCTAPFETFSINKRGTGVRSYKAGFRMIGENDTYANDSDHDAFYRLTRGLVSSNTPADGLSFSCEGMEFQECRTGMRVNGTLAQQVIFNNFYIPQNVVIPGEMNRIPEGIYLLGSSAYTIEENHFTTLGTDVQSGIIVDNSGPNDDVIFRNYFDRLGTGIYSKKINASYTLDTQGQVDDRGERGLQNRCNFFTQNRIDIYAGPGSIWKNVQGAFSQFIQDRTNNKFSYNGCFNDEHDVLINDDYGVIAPANDPTLDFFYLHINADITRPECESVHMDLIPNSLNPEPFEYESACPSNYTVNDDGGGTHTPHLHKSYKADDERERTSIETDIYQERIALEGAKALYELTVDHGEKLDLLAAIQETMTVTSSELKDLLYAKSPLSEEVLKEAIGRSPAMDPWHLTQVMLANTPLDKGVLYTLEESGLLSDFFLSFVYNAQENSTDGIKRLLEYEIAHRYSMIGQDQTLLLQRSLHEGWWEDEEVAPDRSEVLGIINGLEDSRSTETAFMLAWESRDFSSMQD
ncbi:MAG: hypothetical protein HKN79_12440, partial [Flavobacteriales bacterium]|nr:hypothetical protein [Flavobacteriales bacterium]